MMCNTRSIINITQTFLKKVFFYAKLLSNEINKCPLCRPGRSLRKTLRRYMYSIYAGEWLSEVVSERKTH
jgi:hypothetical protein